MVSYDPNDWYLKGKKEGEMSVGKEKFGWYNLKGIVEGSVDYIKVQYPHLGDFDHLNAVEILNEERLSAEPDYKVYPELKGLKECYVEQQRGFIEGAGCTRKEMAFFYNWFWYITKRLSTRYVAKVPDASTQCTAVYIKNSEEGPLMGRNNDIPLPDNFYTPIPAIPAERHLIASSVSSALICDDEPKEIFPADPFKLMAEETKSDVNKVVEFLKRYNEFWGPQNVVLIDKNMNSVAVEKSNCHIGVRQPYKESSCVTACSYITPEMKELKYERDRLSIKVRGWTEDCGDWAFWRGAEKRYYRLLKLTQEETDRGASLLGVEKIVTDHAVPFPDRICLAGEVGHKDLAYGNWTVFSYSCVMEGQNQRMRLRRVENRQPVYDTVPYLVLGRGVQAKEEWKEGTRLVPEDEEIMEEAY